MHHRTSLVRPVFVVLFAWAAMQIAGCSSPTECLPGWVLQGSTCVDIDECATGANTCSPNATCTNLAPSAAQPARFSCACRSGYSGDGTSCNDVNECLTTCATGTCVNTSGSYRCCATPCATGASCNLSQQCECPPGTTGDPLTRCVGNASDCNPACGLNASCVRTNAATASYQCECNSGFVDINGACVESARLGGDCMVPTGATSTTYGLCGRFVATAEPIPGSDQSPTYDLVGSIDPQPSAPTAPTAPTASGYSLSAVAP